MLTISIDAFLFVVFPHRSEILPKTYPLHARLERPLNIATADFDKAPARTGILTELVMVSKDAGWDQLSLNRIRKERRLARNFYKSSNAVPRKNRTPMLSDSVSMHSHIR